MSKKRKSKKRLCYKVIQNRYYYALNQLTGARYYIKSLECISDVQRKRLADADKKILSASIDISKALISLELNFSSPNTLWY